MKKYEAIKAYLAIGMGVDAVAAKVGTSRTYVLRLKKEIDETAKPKDSVVGFFTDLHEPACHPRFFEFVRDTFKAHGVTPHVQKSR